MLMISGLLSILVLIAMILIPINKDNGYLLAWIPTVGFGIWFSIYDAARWPTISLLLNDDTSALGFGLVNAVNNASMTVWE